MAAPTRFTFTDDSNDVRLSGFLTPEPTGATSGQVIPVADATGVTVDTTTYADTIRGGGAKLTTLVFPGDQGALAIAISGDSFPRYVIASDPHNDGIYMGNGSYNPVSDGIEVYLSGSSDLGLASLGGGSINLGSNASILATGEGDFSGKIAAAGGFGGNPITSGALPTQQLVSGTGAQLSTGRNVESHTPVTFNPGVATTATCTVAISPDNVTYSTLAIVTKPVGTVFDGTIEDVVASLPGAWYLKLTVNAQAVLGLTTYY